MTSVSRSTMINHGDQRIVECQMNASVATAIIMPMNVTLTLPYGKRLGEYQEGCVIIAEITRWDAIANSANLSITITQRETSEIHTFVQSAIASWLAP